MKDTRMGNITIGSNMAIKISLSELQLSKLASPKSEMSAQNRIWQARSEACQFQWGLEIITFYDMSGSWGKIETSWKNSSFTIPVSLSSFFPFLCERNLTDDDARFPISKWQGFRDAKLFFLFWADFFAELANHAQRRANIPSSLTNRIHQANKRSKQVSFFIRNQIHIVRFERVKCTGKARFFVPLIFIRKDDD